MPRLAPRRLPYRNLGRIEDFCRAKMQPSDESQFDCGPRDTPDSSRIPSRSRWRPRRQDRGAARRVAAVEAQERELADAIAHMKPKAALAVAADQAKRREATARARQEAADKLAELQGSGGRPRRRPR